MAHPEHNPFNQINSPKPQDAAAALARRLELVDEIENPIERFFKRDDLLEELDWLQAESAASDPDGQQIP